MRKLPIIMASLVLSFSLFSASAFAAEPPAEGAANPTNPTPTSQPSLPAQPEQLTDNSQRVVTDGLYLDIYYPSDQSTYIPDFILELWDVKTDTKISSTTGNSQNYANGKYSLIFNHPGYKLGDELALILKQADPLIEELNFNGIHLKPNTHHKFTIDQFTYYEGDNNEQAFQDLTATKLNPLQASMVTNPKLIGLSLVSESGTPLKGKEVEIKLLKGKGSFTAQSDSNGIIWLNTDKLTWKFLISAKGLTAVKGSNGKAEVELPAEAITNTQKSAVILPIVFKSADQSVVDSNISVSLSTNANLDLSKAWSEFDLTLTDANGVSSTYVLDLDSTNIQGLQDGQYKLEANAKYADIKLDSASLSIKRGKGFINGTIQPKNQLEISKDGKQYSFSVINVQSLADKKYTGTKPQTFAVTPGESFMIKDNDTGNVTTVAIDANSPTTRLILGAGVVFGGSASTPHTGDTIVYLVILAVVSAMLACGALMGYWYQKNRKERVQQ